MYCFPSCLQLQQQGILKSDDLITRFFRISVEMCVDLCYRTLNDQVHTYFTYKSTFNYYDGLVSAKHFMNIFA